MNVGPFETGKIYQGDCLDLLKEIPAGAVALIWTDPPYGNRDNDGDLRQKWEGACGWKLGKGVYDEARPILNDGKADRDRVIMGMLLEAGRILQKKENAICLCCGGGGPLPLWSDVIAWLSLPPLEFFHAVVWHKGDAGLGWRYRRNYEFVMVGKTRRARLLWADRSPHGSTSNVVRITRLQPGKEDHPTPKPVALVEHFLRLHTKPGEIVLDPFAGAGTTGVACANLGREFLGFELDPHWAEVGNERISAALRGLEPEEARMGQLTFWDLCGAQ